MRIDSALWRRTPTVLRHGLPAVVGLGLLLVVTGGLSEYRNTQLAEIATTVCAVAGLTVLTGLSGQVSIGNGAFMFIGAYTVALLLKHFPSIGIGQDFSRAHTAEFVLILLAAAVAAALVGGLVGVAAARLRGPYLAGVTLALAIGLPVLPKYSHLQGPLGGHAGFAVDAPVGPSSVGFFQWQAWVCCVAAVLVLFLLANLSRSRVGRAFRAVRDDEIAASLAGLSVARVQILAFVVSAGCAGLAGGLFADVAGSVGPDSFPLTLSVGLLAAAVFGGLGTLSGAIYGSIVVTLLPSWSQDLANHVSLSTNVVKNLPFALYGLGLILGMLIFPLGVQGLLRRLGLGARRVVSQRVPAK
jgi:branched-chain amino acid transport system permease protein